MKNFLKNVYYKISPNYRKTCLLEKQNEEIFKLLNDRKIFEKQNEDILKLLNYQKIFEIYLKLILLNDNNPFEDQENKLTSQICNLEFWNNSFFKKWVLIIKEDPLNFHRKIWEYIYITQVLWENNLLNEGKKGLGFAVGTEPLPALFASMGCEILATDIDANNELGKDWLICEQNANGEIKKLNKRGICNDEIFSKNVKYKNVDMNDIPNDLKDFDFCWSSCAVEHIGGLDKSINHICNCMNTLKPGGILVFTTEYNITSEEETIENPYNYVFTKKNIETIIEKLENEGHYVYPLDLRLGNLSGNKYVDLPPYHQKLHLRLLMDGFEVTSIGIIVKRN
jgi:SAM-dependent methyltransferase